MEGSCSTKGNTEEAHTCRTQGRERVSQGLGGVREAARRDKKQKFTALLHHVTVDLLRDSYYALKRKAAPGVDGVTWQQYGRGSGGADDAIFMTGSIGAPIARNRQGEHIYPKPMAGNGR